MSEQQLSPASERNKQPILERLQALLPAQGRALEVASGTGQHVAWFAAAMPGWTWQPTDATKQNFGSILSWCAGLATVSAPLQLDVLAAQWPLDESLSGPSFSQGFDLIYCANMLHIAPRACCAGLMQGAARHLLAQGLLVTYGPYLEDAVPTSPGNLAFDAELRARNPDWGIRRLADVVAVAEAAGLALQARFEMPANNLLLVWQRSPPP